MASMREKFVAKVGMAIFDLAINNVPHLRKFAWHKWYDMLSSNPEKGKTWTFMNYGFMELTVNKEQEFLAKTWKNLKIDGLHHTQHHMARLYYHIATCTPQVEIGRAHV